MLIFFSEQPKPGVVTLLYPASIIKLLYLSKIVILLTDLVKIPEWTHIIKIHRSIRRIADQGPALGAHTRTRAVFGWKSAEIIRSRAYQLPISSTLSTEVFQMYFCVHILILLSAVHVFWKQCNLRKCYVSVYNMESQY